MERSVSISGPVFAPISQAQQQNLQKLNAILLLTFLAFEDIRPALLVFLVFSMLG